MGKLYNYIIEFENKMNLFHPYENSVSHDVVYLLVVFGGFIHEEIGIAIFNEQNHITGILHLWI